MKEGRQWTTTAMPNGKATKETMANAEAQYTAAAKTSTLEPTARSLEALSNVFKRDAKLVEVLGAPTLNAQDKKQIVAELQKHVGGADKEGVVKNFLNTLAENNRLGVLESVCEKFGVLMGAYRGEVELIVTSAAVRALVLFVFLPFLRRVAKENAWMGGCMVSV